MPTAILLDNSLSMSKRVNNETNMNKREIAFRILNKIVDHLSKNDKYEQIALVSS